MVSAYTGSVIVTSPVSRALGTPAAPPRLSEALELTPAAAADEYRAAARQMLRERNPGLSFPVSSEVEMTALTLFEKSMLAAPAAAVDATRNLGPHALYTGCLAALMGCPGGGLSAGAAAILDSFHCWREPQGQSRLRTLGEFDDQVLAARTAGPNTELRCGEFRVGLSGHLQEREVTNLQSAMQEIVTKTQTKALHLVREIYLRPFLAEYQYPDGQLAAIDGMAYGRQRVGVLHTSARDLDTCRQALFHELGHELDHILSGGKGFFRSEREDTPFGKTQNRNDYVSDYAATSPAEDFAETHAALIQEWDTIKQSPRDYLHNRGEVGKKMAWILKHGYREEV